MTARQAYANYRWRRASRRRHSPPAGAHEYAQWVRDRIAIRDALAEVTG